MVTLTAGRVLVVPAPSASPLLLYLTVGDPGSVDGGGWLRRRVPGVLPNDDTAHGVQVYFDMYSLVTKTSDTVHENKNRTVKTEDVVHCEKCVTIVAGGGGRGGGER